MFGNSDVASIDATELEDLPPEAQAFHRRARIVDAAVREIAEHGYDQAAETAIAERAGVTQRVFYETFAGKEEALMWAYDIAAAYAIPQILRALRAERDWERGAAAALTTYLAILDCDRAWALACLRDVPAAGRRARAARDVLRAPVLEALATRPALPAAGGLGVETMLTAIDAIAVDGLRCDPDQPLLARRKELAAFALAPFTDAPPPADVPAVRPHPPLDAAAVEGLLDAGAEEDLEVLVREAVIRRDGPTLWRVVAGVQRRRAAGEHVGRRAERVALEALGDAWFFGLALDHDDDAFAAVELLRYLRFVAAHPGSGDEEVRQGLGIRSRSEVRRRLQGLEAEGLVRRERDAGGADGWWTAATARDASI
ncbi:TetR family transcriptional regulator [Baekduia sp.]|jgi:AcrR family transcriptional regulator|uniref:TetR family transcriptional regulator n=1 Tax=Baekduia sp. TaxID=2600305 RepID=UPI002E03188F|nr:TetR family transcriptional regulator [Baekduia sp.]